MEESSTSFGSGLTTVHCDPESSNVSWLVLPSRRRGLMSIPLVLSSCRTASNAVTTSGTKEGDVDRALVLKT